MATKVATKPKVETEPEETKRHVSTVPATTTPDPRAVPDHLKALLAESEGRGVSTNLDDNVIPLIYLLQGLSPQCDERDDNYVEGAKPGEIWLRGAAVNPIRRGEEGIIFQHCAFEKCWVEWKPKRGGFVARHDERPADAEEAEVMNDEGEPQMVWQRPNKNLVVETRYHYGFVDDMAYVIPFSSSGHTVSRGWMALMNQFKDQRGRPLDAFAKVYRLTTVRRENAHGKWFVFKVDDAGWASVEQYKAGALLYKAVTKGEKRAEADASGGDGIDPNATSADAATKAGI